MNFQSSRVMRVAQELYEGVNIGAELGGTQGLITYMRTDSLRVSAEAQTAAAELIRGRYGERYCPETPRVYKARAGAQDAHEAIRPARVEIEPWCASPDATSTDCISSSGALCRQPDGIRRAGNADGRSGMQWLGVPRERIYRDVPRLYGSLRGGSR